MATKIQLAVGLDAGSSRTRCIICALDGDHIRYLSHGLAESAGWAKGRVNDQVALAESIRAAVADAERGAQIPVDSVTVGVGGVSVVGAQSRGRYEFGRPREVDAEDLAYAVRLAADVRLERDRMLLHVLPQDFTLDGRAGFRKPHKGVCSRLEANVHIVTASYQEHQAVIAAVASGGAGCRGNGVRADGCGVCVPVSRRAAARRGGARHGTAFVGPGGV